MLLPGAKLEPPAARWSGHKLPGAPLCIFLWNLLSCPILCCQVSLSRGWEVVVLCWLSGSISLHIHLCRPCWFVGTARAFPLESARDFGENLATMTTRGNAVEFVAQRHRSSERQ